MFRSQIGQVELLFLRLSFLHDYGTVYVSEQQL